MLSWIKFEGLCATDFVSSPVVPSSVLLAVRTAFFLWNSIVLLYIYSIEWGNLALPLPVYLTFQSYTIICFYFFLTLLVTYQNRTIYKMTVSYSVNTIERQPLTTSMKIMWVLFEMFAPLALFVTLIYWSLIYPKEQQVRMWSDVHIHAVNSFVMMTELALNRLVFVPTHVIFMLTFGAYYLVWGFIVNAIWGKWAYYFLDPSVHKYVWIYYIFLIILSLCLYFTCYALARLRDTLTNKDEAKQPLSSLVVP
eukprot:TRINITY_DN595_c0_g1_i1.p1 TRINITY_DN595_c0_g1~~TRINITY_DN595_c0_g1_i1.p1  ORF type:complete len:252 (+),score=31.25 TRINITY_DN595_c0_g1_i1:88-843(+)